jgi:hypothetical protein
MMVEGKVGLYYKNRKKHITALCGKYIAILNVKANVPLKGRGESVTINNVL